MTNTADDVLVRARAGDRAAFDVLAASVVDRLYALARLMLRDADLAEDAVQETLVRCWRGLPGLRDARAFDGWLRRLLVHAVIDEFRSVRRHSANVRLLERDPIGSDITEGAALRDQLARGFTRLSIEQRTVIVLRFYADLSLEQVATAVGASVGTVKSRQHYALEVLRGALEADALTADREVAS